MELVEKKAIGRFGEVWRGNCQGKEVAVKVFLLRERQSWANETKVLGLTGMQHPNILKILGSHVTGDGLDTQFWLITEYHHLGSLHDYLISNVVTWNQLLDIALSILR